MGFWKRVGNFLFGPMPAYKEKPGRQAPLTRVLVPTQTRRYDVAVPSNLTADWQAWATSANYEIYTAWRRTTYLARDLERNNSHAKAFLRELCANVLGASGIQIQPKVRMLRGGDLNDDLNATIKKAWIDWRRRGNFDVTGLISGYKMDKLVLRQLARDGEVLLRVVRGYPNKYRLAIQLLEPDHLDLWYNVLLDAKTNRRVTMGVEVDQWGKPLNYHMLKYNQQDLFATNMGMAGEKRVVYPANEIIHIFVQERASQCRGISWFAPASIKLRMLDRYEEATAVAMRISASKMGFLKPDKDAQQYTGEGQLPTGETFEEMSPGEIRKLLPGWSFECFDPTNPSENLTNFRKGMLRSVASALGIMYNNLANDLESTNYSSARYGRTIEVENWRDQQHFLSEDYLQLLFNVFADQATLTGAVAGISEANIDTVKESIAWKPRGWAYVDPDKDGKSAANGIDMGLTTRRRELEEQGLDIDEVYEELAEDKKRQEKYGLTFVNSWSRMPAVQSTEEDPGATGPEVAEPVQPAQKNGNGTKSKSTAVTPNRK